MGRRGNRLATALVLAACASAALGARSEWYDHYLAARRAIEEGRPGAAVGELEAALAQRPKPGYYRTYGANYLRYTPYYFLGVALHDAGLCEQALRAFERSAAEKELADRPAALAQRRALVEACRTKLHPAARSAEPAAPPAPEPEQRPRVRLPRRQLERAVRAYLAGEFAAARRAFEELVGEAPDSATLHAMLGSVLIAMAEGDDDAEALAAGRRELRRALVLDPRLELDARFFSPRVLETFEGLR